MAASSSKLSCFQCNDSTSDTYRNGWKLHSGEYANLCHRCASLYEVGRFCEIFHSNDDGWTDCQSCAKLVHCGCVVSFNAYLLLDQGGVICTDCSKMNFLLARNHSYAREFQPDLAYAPDIAKRIRLEPHYWPQGADSGIPSIHRTSKSTVNPLFEKILTASDSDLRLGRIVIPKKCAEAFFPEISDPQGLPLNILDTEGKEWNFCFRYWPNSGRKMYILEGLRGFMISREIEAGDTLTFYRVEPEGKMVMEFRKTSIVKPVHQGTNLKKKLQASTQ